MPLSPPPQIKWLSPESLLPVIHYTGELKEPPFSHRTFYVFFVCCPSFFLPVMVFPFCPMWMHSLQQRPISFLAFVFSRMLVFLMDTTSWNPVTPPTNKVWGVARATRLPGLPLANRFFSLQRFLCTAFPFYLTYLRPWWKLPFGSTRCLRGSEPMK